jgi:elongation factor P hydroxylase
MVCSSEVIHYWNEGQGQTEAQNKAFNNIEILVGGLGWKFCRKKRFDESKAKKPQNENPAEHVSDEYKWIIVLCDRENGDH